MELWSNEQGLKEISRLNPYPGEYQWTNSGMVRLSSCPPAFILEVHHQFSYVSVDEI